MSFPLYPVAHNVPVDFGLNVGYDFIRQSASANPEAVGMCLSLVNSPFLRLFPAFQVH